MEQSGSRRERLAHSLVAGVFQRILSVVSPLLVSIRYETRCEDQSCRSHDFPRFLPDEQVRRHRATWAAAIAYFITMINRLYFATFNISKPTLQTILCSVVAWAGIALGIGNHRIKHCRTRSQVVR
jgi:hypothetical protein